MSDISKIVEVSMNSEQRQKNKIHQIVLCKNMHLCKVVCIEIILLCTEISMNSENILKLVIYSTLSYFLKLFLVVLNKF